MKNLTLDRLKQVLRYDPETTVINQRNQKARNRIGHAGISQLPSGRWRARITVDYISHELGVFDTLEAAIEARRRTEREHGFYDRQSARS